MIDQSDDDLGGPVPADETARAMFTAHRIDNTSSELMHARERIGAAALADRKLRLYHLAHVNAHLDDALVNTRELADNLRRNYPAEGAELDKLEAAQSSHRSTAQVQKENTFAHLTQTVMYHLSHAQRHGLTAVQAESKPEWEFDRDHLTNHVSGALEHVGKLAGHVRDNYPDEWRYLQPLMGQRVPAKGPPPQAATAQSAEHMGPALVGEVRRLCSIGQQGAARELVRSQPAVYRRAMARMVTPADPPQVVMIVLDLTVMPSRALVTGGRVFCSDPDCRVCARVAGSLPGAVPHGR